MASPRRAFTLVEVLVALSILVVLVTIVWTVASQWMRDSSVGMWREKTSQEIGRATLAIRKYISEAKFPAANTPEKLAVAMLEEHYVVLNPEGHGQAYGENEPWDEEKWSEHIACKRYVFGPGTDASWDEQTIMTLVQGQAGFARLPDQEKRAVAGTQVRLFLKGRKPVRYRGEPGPYQITQELHVETTEAAPVDAESFDAKTALSFSGKTQTRRLLEDVNRVIVFADYMHDAKTDQKVPVGIMVLCVEPANGRATLKVKVVAEPQSGVWAK